jgi:hypothetical protein
MEVSRVSPFLLWWKGLQIEQISTTDTSSLSHKESPQTFGDKSECGSFFASSVMRSLTKSPPDSLATQGATLAVALRSPCQVLRVKI